MCLKTPKLHWNKWRVPWLFRLVWFWLLLHFTLIRFLLNSEELGLRKRSWTRLLRQNDLRIRRSHCVQLFRLTLQSRVPYVIILIDLIQKQFFVDFYSWITSINAAKISVVSCCLTHIKATIDKLYLYSQDHLFRSLQNISAPVGWKYQKSKATLLCPSIIPLLLNHISGL